MMPVIEEPSATSIVNINICSLSQQAEIKGRYSGDSPLPEKPHPFFHPFLERDPSKHQSKQHKLYKVGISHCVVFSSAPKSRDIPTESLCMGA